MSIYSKCIEYCIITLLEFVLAILRFGLKDLVAIDWFLVRDTFALMCKLYCWVFVCIRICVVEKGLVVCFD